MNFYSFISLGNYGRLGNQMFQVAAMLNLAKRKNAEILLPNNPNVTVRKYFQIPCHDIDEEKLKLIKRRWNEYKFSFCQEFFDLPSQTDIVGYLQSWKYIVDESYTRNIFSFSEETLEKSRSFLDQKKKYVAIHVRRTDYLKFPEVHPVQQLEYYQKSLEKVWSLDSNSIEPIVFSDDKKWCLDNFKNYQIISESEEIDLCTMSLCKHHIMANSSYSWWAAWLGKSNEQIVIAPKKWFGLNGPKDIEDLLKPDIITV